MKILISEYAINDLMTCIIGNDWKINIKWKIIQSCQDDGCSWGSLKEKI